MKRIIVLILSVMLAMVTFGQNDYPINNSDKTKEVYAFVVVIKSTDKTTANIDFGDGSPIMVFADDEGGKRKFATPFEPINQLIEKGWKIDKFSSIISGVNLITHWIMKKKINLESEVREGLKLKTY